MADCPIKIRKVIHRPESWFGHGYERAKTEECYVFVYSECKAAGCGWWDKKYGRCGRGTL